MIPKNFSKKEAFAFGWKKTKENLGFFIGVLAVFFLVAFVPDFFAETFDDVFITFIVSTLGWVVYLITTMGLVNIALKLHDGKETKIGDLFSSYPLFFKFLGGQLLYLLIVFAGLIFFIIPGIIFAIKFWFFDYFIIDKKLGPIEALKRSSQMTDGIKGNLFILHLLMIGINVLGVLAFGVGVFVAVPVTLMAAVFVYRKLLKQIEIEKVVEGEVIEEVKAVA